MPAVHTAADRSARDRLEAERAEFAALTARAMHREYLAAAADSRLARMLTPLTEQGFHILVDRVWPGSTQATVDLLIVGPSGVIIIDAKSWRDVSVTDNKIFQGQADITDRFENLRSLADTAQVSLAEIGLAPGEIRVVAVLMGKSRLHGYVGGVDLIGEDAALDYILDRGARLRPAQVDAALAVIRDLFVPRPDSDVDELEHTLPYPVRNPFNQVVSQEQIESALLNSGDAAPIEDWMAVLGPEQAKIARRSFNGPSRIRGAAGTGKTVVGLHRAAYLARNRPGKVLVTSLIRTLPVVMEQLMQRMAPDVADHIEFTGIHHFALELLRSRGIRVHLNARAAERAFEAAWQEVGKSGLLGHIDPHKAYWRDEVVTVIKGRGLTQFDEYAGLARVGRRRALSTDARRAVWELYGEYEIALREAGIHDFADVILLAERSLRAHPLVGYSSVIADEAQDLSCAMIRMLHALVGDQADGLNLIGDGQQTIYPGGYTLAEADVSIAGRGVVMTTNYRNTAEIADFARSMVRGDEFVDIEGELTKSDVASDVVRHGARPRVSRFTSPAGHDRSLIAQVSGLLAGGTAGGDIAVLTQTNFVASEVLAALQAAGIPAMPLADHDGRPTHSVKVGTVKRSKGLEFKQVLIARASASLLETAWTPADEGEAERRDLDRRELYVAMTRARDGVWVGVA